MTKPDPSKILRAQQRARDIEKLRRRVMPNISADLAAIAGRGVTTAQLGHFVRGGSLTDRALSALAHHYGIHIDIPEYVK